MGQEGTTTTEPQTTSATPPGASAPPSSQDGNQSTQGTPPPAAPDFRSSIPEAFREKSYLRDVKSAEDVFKMLDGAQTLIGKQGKAVPAPDAPKEEWDRFFNLAGRPESPDKYEFKREEGVQVDPEWDKGLRQALHEAGVSTRQLEVLGPKFDQLVAQQIEKERGQTEAKFVELSNKVFGQDAQKHIDESTVLINELAPAEAKELIPHLDNNSLILLASVMKTVKEKYVSEDRVRLQGDGNANRGLDEAGRKAKANEIMSSPEFKDPLHPGHAAKVAEWNALYGRK